MSPNGEPALVERSREDGTAVAEELGPVAPPPFAASPAPILLPKAASGPFTAARTVPAPDERPRPLPSVHAVTGLPEAKHPFGLAPEWPSASPQAREPMPGSAPAATVPTAGMLDSPDVDEASIEAFYKWAAKARAASRMAVAAPESTSSSSQSSAALPAIPTAIGPLPTIGAIADVRPDAAPRPKIRLRVAAPHISRKWVVVGLAACVAVAIVVYAIVALVTPGRGAATAQEAASATLIRAGVRTELTSYEALQLNDEIKVGAGGHVNLTIDDSHIRLGPAADVKLAKIDLSHVVLDQLAGEVY